MSAETQHNTSFLAGGGEMGELIRNKDWSKTPVGSPETWPQSLRTTLSIILNSKFPMFLWWGPELISFYNDAYRPSLGKNGKHPSILGQAAETAWAEIWPIIAPLINQVLQGGEATWSEDQLIPIYRNGILEDVYWTFSYSPVNDESGRPSGVLVTCYETTEKVRVLTGVKERENQLQYTIEAAELGTWDLNPFTNHFVGNERLKAWFGLGPDEEIDLALALNNIVEEDRQRVIDAIQAVLTPGSGGNYEIEYCIENPLNGEQRQVRAKGKAIFDENKVACRFSGILQDISEHKLAREKVEESEEERHIARKELIESEHKIRALVESAPFPIGVYVGSEMRIELANQTIADIWGKGNDLVGKLYAEVLPELSNQQVYDQLSQVYNTGIPFHAKNQPIDLMIDGELRTFYFTYSFTPLYDTSGNIYGVMNTAADVTELNVAKAKIEKSEKQFRNIVREAPLGIIIFRGPQFIVETANDTYLQLVDQREENLLNQPFFERLPELADTVEPILTGVLTTGIPYNGVEFPIFLNRYGRKDLTYFNFVYHPLRTDAGDVWGIMVVATEVTASVKAKHALLESEKQFRNMVMQSPMAMTIFRGKDHVIEMANRVMLDELWRKKESEVIGKKALEVFPELNDQKYPKLLQDVYNSGIIHRENEAIADVQGNDGMRRFYLDFEYAPLYETDGSVSGIFITVNDVTEKVEARLKVEESERRFRNVADSAPVLIWMSGMDKGCTFFNTAWLNFTGRSMEEELGAGWTDNVHPDDFVRCVEVYESAFDRQEEFYMEYRLKRHDGEYRWLSDKGAPRFTADGIFEGYIGACMDIHEQVIYQKKLKEDEERLNIVIGASELGTWEINLKTREVNYSNRYLEILGYRERVELSHVEILKHLHPEDLPIRNDAYKRAFETGVLYYESRIIWNDQSIHWVEGKGKVFYDEENTPVLLIGTVRDITDEKNYQQRLEEREQKFRLLAHSMPQFVWTGDAEGNLNYFNRSVFNFSGLTPEQVTNGGWIEIVHPDDREENIRLWLKSVTTGKDFNFEHRFRRHDGVYRWQLSRAIPQKDEAGNIQMWVGTSTDIEDQKMFTQELEKQVRERTSLLEESNEKLEDSIRELQKMNAELQSFAYVSSHDLQEPLRKIQTFAGRIMDKERQNLSETGRDYFQRMQDAAKRMQTLIEDLLTYSRTNTTERVFKKTDLREIIAEVKLDFRETMLENHAIIEIGAMCEANIIPFQFRQLMHNLIGNALKFSKPGIPPLIRISSRIEQGAQLDSPQLAPQKWYCHLCVSDNGIGFHPQYKDRIFEVFQRLHGKNEYEGTGIGLAIVKKIVENHNGVIEATSEEDQGARFDMYIPV